MGVQLLYARMARSYNMQLALALLTIYAAVEWMKSPKKRRRHGDNTQSDQRQLNLPVDDN